MSHVVVASATGSGRPMNCCAGWWRRCWGARGADHHRAALSALWLGRTRPAAGRRPPAGGRDPSRWRTYPSCATQSTLVQSSYCGAYFCLAPPAAFSNQRFNYKVGVLLGLGLAAGGGLLFLSAAASMTYSFFLIAIFCLAAGLSVLEASANPYVVSMGPEGNAARRLSFAQAFNPIGTNLGVLLAALLILPGADGLDRQPDPAGSSGGRTDGRVLLHRPGRVLLGDHRLLDLYLGRTACHPRGRLSGPTWLISGRPRAALPSRT